MNAYHVEVTDKMLRAGGVTLKGNKIEGFGKAIVLKKGSFAIGTH